MSGLVLVNDYCLNIDKIKLYIHILHYIKQTWYFALGGGYHVSYSESSFHGAETSHFGKWAVSIEEKPPIYRKWWVSIGQKPPIYRNGRFQG